jgi:NAD dependent epimerase/dehydratase family enzyme
LGSGKQFMPWVHIKDICSIYEFALKNSNLDGAYNATAPEHITNEDLTKNIAKTLRKPLFMPNVPRFVLKLIFGELADALLEGSRASSQKIQDAGFQFEFPRLEMALEDLLKNN